MRVVLLCADGRTLLCPVRMTGRAILALFDRPSLALVSKQSLRDGGVYHRAVYVGPNDQAHTLSDYIEIHSRDREMVASIKSVDVLISANSNAVVGSDDGSAPFGRLNPDEPVLVPQELLCQCDACARG